MPYDLMLLADPGTERAEVLRVLSEAEDVRPDPRLDTRFWLAAREGKAQINIGTKDPVESVHLEIEAEQPPLLGAVARRALELGDRLGMRLEDVQWGHEVTRENLAQLLAHWEGKSAIPPAHAGRGEAQARPWWRFW